MDVLASFKNDGPVPQLYEPKSSKEPARTGSYDYDLRFIGNISITNWFKLA